MMRKVRPSTRRLWKVAHRAARKCVKTRGVGGGTVSLASHERANPAHSLVARIGIRVAHTEIKVTA